MGQKRYDKILEIMREYDGAVLDVALLRKLVRIEFGGDQRTVIGYLHLMEDLGVIKEIEPMKFKVDINENILDEIKKRIKSSKKLIPA